MAHAAKNIQDSTDAADFAALLNETAGTSFEGKVVKGKVIEIDNEFVIIDVGLKSEGRVS